MIYFQRERKNILKMSESDQLQTKICGIIFEKAAI